MTVLAPVARLLDSHVYALWPSAMGCHPCNNNNNESFACPPRYSKQKFYYPYKKQARLPISANAFPEAKEQQEALHPS